MSNKDLVPENVDWKTVDLLAYMRREGLSNSEIALVEVVADVEVNVNTKKGYMDWLRVTRNVNFTYPQICRVWAKPVFQKCVNLLTAQYEGAAIRAINKNMMNRAAHPTDSHAVAAAKLIYQKMGLMKANESTGKDTSEQQLVSMMMEYRNGQVTGQIKSPGRRFTVISEELPPEEQGAISLAKSDNVFDGEYTVGASPVPTGGGTDDSLGGGTDDSLESSEEQEETSPETEEAEE